MPLGMLTTEVPGLVWMMVGGFAGGIIGKVLLAATCGGVSVGVEMRLLRSVKTWKDETLL